MMTYFHLGLLYRDQNRWQEAVAAFQTAGQVNPYQGETFFQLAEAQLKLDDKTSAIQSLEHAVKISPTNPKYQDRLNTLRTS